jgi:hypothetical protein
MLKQFLLILGIHESMVDEYIENNWWVETPAADLGVALEKFVAAQQSVQRTAGTHECGDWIDDEQTGLEVCGVCGRRR